MKTEFNRALGVAISFLATLQEPKKVCEAILALVMPCRKRPFDTKKPIALHVSLICPRKRRRTEKSDSIDGVMFGTRITFDFLRTFGVSSVDVNMIRSFLGFGCLVMSPKIFLSSES